MVLVCCMPHAASRHKYRERVISDFTGSKALAGLSTSVSSRFSRSSTTMLDAWKSEICLACLALYAKTPP